MSDDIIAILLLLLSFTAGFTICSIISWQVHRRHKQAWQKEYRRLMGGIDGVRQIALLSVDVEDLKGVAEKLSRLLYNDEPFWPRE